MKFRMTKKTEKAVWNLIAELILKNPRNLEKLTGSEDYFEVNN